MGFFSRLLEGMKKTKKSFSEKLGIDLITGSAKTQS